LRHLPNKEISQSVSSQVDTLLFICYDGVDNYSTRCYSGNMLKLMTKHFAKWAKKQNIPNIDLAKSLNEVEEGNFEANLGGHVIKKRIRFQGKGKSGSGRTIICYKQADRAFFIHGFAKNEKSNLTSKELHAFKELAKVLLSLSNEKLNIAIEKSNIMEVKS
jgi:hypothetical protein